MTYPSPEEALSYCGQQYFTCGQQSCHQVSWLVGFQQVLSGFGGLLPGFDLVLPVFSVVLTGFYCTWLLKSWGRLLFGGGTSKAGECQECLVALWNGSTGLVTTFNYFWCLIPRTTSVFLEGKVQLKGALLSPCYYAWPSMAVLPFTFCVFGFFSNV